MSLPVCLSYAMCVCLCVMHMCEFRCAHVTKHMWRSEDTFGCQSLPSSLLKAGSLCHLPLHICIAGRKAPWESPAPTSTVGLRLQTHATVSSFYVGPHDCVASVCLLSRLPSPNPVLSQSLERYHFLTSHCSLFL